MKDFNQVCRLKQSFEHVLASINKLNRSLESVITVGNEFSSVEALWSQFENVMAKDDETTTGSGGSGNGRSATMGEQQQQQHKEEEEDQGLKEEERDA